MWDKLGKETRWGKIRGCLGPSYDLHHIHENSVETLGPKTALSINIKIQKYDH